MSVTQGIHALVGWRYARALRSAALLALLLAVAPKLVLAAGADDPPPTKKPVNGKDVLPQVALINEQVRARWTERGITPSTPATDGEWCRRAYLDVLGRIPKVDELKRFLDDPPQQRKARLADRLLGEEHVEDYARNWTTLWTNLLIGRSGGTERRSLVNRQGLQQSLRRALQRDMPYDRLAYELISATGVSKPGEEGFNGFVNFLAGSLQENGVQATVKTSQIFLGLQIQCTQCHNHPFNTGWHQDKFWEMNAFFRQTRPLRRFEKGREIAAVELVNQDFAGDNNSPEEAVVFYELRNGLLKSAYPTFVDGAKLATNSGFVTEVDRRTELAKLIIASDYLAKAQVNRTWSHFLGYGFTRPVESPDNDPSHPDLLEALAREFKTHSYNQKELIRWILLSEPYSLSSKLNAKNKKDDPALGDRPLFSHFYLRQMRAEELYESLLVATEAQNTESSYEKQEATKREWLEQFTLAFGTDDNEETTTFNGTIPQTLMMMNGDLVNQATKVDKGSFLHRVAADRKMSNAAKINFLYMAALARKPTAPEINVANELLAARYGDPAAALQDVWWAILNSNEFILNH